jgi:glycosyltransferase involved in cell wall biosynthesis
MNPTVSFVVPCYGLAHLLPECINSILSQTFHDFEVLIMDDCSPDHTMEVARSYRDRRVYHVRNEHNLGHLRNYNKGIGLARGKYVWLISADDYLLRPYVLEKYVRLLEKRPRVGYAFCPGVGGDVFDCGSNGWLLWGQSIHGKTDRIFKGHSFLKKLLAQNTIVAASGFVRRECYEKMGLFPLDMPWAGDWYMWCLFAQQFDVAYFAEPMVCYRDHELNMTKKLWNENASVCCKDDLAIPWAIKQKADEAGLRNISRNCLVALAQIYARSIATTRYGMSKPALTLQEFEYSLRRNSPNETERAWLRARVYAGIGNEYYWQGERLLAKQFYKGALHSDPWITKVHAKRLLLSLGGPGDAFRRWWLKNKSGI